MRREQIAHFAQRLVGGHDLKLRLGRTREEKEIPDDAFEPGQFTGHEFGVGVLGRAALEFALVHEQPGLDGRERIADFVGDPRREHAERREFFLVFQQRLTLDQPDVEWRDQLAIDHQRQPRAEHQQEEQRAEQQRPQVRERFVGAGQRDEQHFPMGLAQLRSEVQQARGLILELSKLGDRHVGAGVGLGLEVHQFGRIVIIVIGGVDLVEQLPLGGRRQMLLVNPLV